MGNNKKVSNITLAIPRSFKNMNGEYETDFINCVLWDSIAKSTVEYCRKVKGRIQSKIVEKEDEGKKYYVEVVAEKITFLSSDNK